MIVLWSENSVDSSWVAEEAEEARRLGKTLVPVLIQRVEPPIGFRAIQAADLSRWDGSAEDGAGQMLVADLRSLLGAPDGAANAVGELRLPPGNEKLVVPPWYLTYWPKAALALVAVAVLALLWKNWPGVQTDVAAPPVERKRAELAPPPQATDLSVRGAQKTLEPSQILDLTAAAKYSDGSERQVNDGIGWSSSDTRVATVDERGKVKALRAGTTKIKAKLGAVESSEWIVSVADAKPPVQPVAVPALVGLTISAGRRDLVEKDKVVLHAKGKYSDGSEKTLSRGVQWQSSDRTIASINDSGELVASRPGRVEIVARADQLRSAPFAFSVKAARVVEPPPKVVKAIEVPAVKQPAAAEEAKASIAAYVRRAESFREEGNYTAALAELEKAKAIDATSEVIRKEIEQTKRACTAERVLGNKPNC
jgi:hypothetical protein